MTKEQFNEITDWQDETFPESTELSRVKHLIKEVCELEFEAKIFEKSPTAHNRSNKNQEYADCFFLLFGAAKKAGMSYEDICRAIDFKFEINKNRTWGKPDENGVVEHV
jgi:NTP pyrophosphatase (non-canonical NTP hydrolase)